MDRKTFVPVTQELQIDCPYCGENIDVEVDRAERFPQQFVEDCETCCQPIYVTVRIGYDGRLESDVRTEEEE